MTALITWVQHNPGQALAIAYAVLSAANGALKKRGGWHGSVADKLHLVMDFLSILARSDGHHQTWKLPGTKSRSVSPPPTPST
jgi:hypothetical protein